MRAALGLLHLLLLAEALADDLVDRRLHKADADALPILVALAIVKEAHFASMNKNSEATDAVSRAVRGRNVVVLRRWQGQ
jgi:hypothetical protein